MSNLSDQAGAERVTTLLKAIGTGDRHAASELLPLLYDNLRQLAEYRLARLAPGQTLQPTALVHEAYLKLVGDADPGWDNRGHFFGAAAQAMREILVDQARRKGRIKHGGERKRVELPPHLAASADGNEPNEEILSVDRVLDRMKKEHPRQAEIVLLRFFAGLTNEQTAEALGVSSRTVERDWRFARAWLLNAMRADSGPFASG
ncbi:MAG: sigma-70 family RNA polymerase sigma factor [Planctomycetota bacterium]|nr:sigma-70 family RNA polymerase sigma factor [Planctomycetota bacterium]